MKKIEPVAWIDDGGMLFCNDGIIPDGTDLYAENALQAVAEAVLKSVAEVEGHSLAECKEIIDIDAIINKLKGE